MAPSSIFRRVALSTVAGLSAAALTFGLAPSAGAEPTIAQVTTQIDALGHKNEQLTELFNRATIDVTAKQKQAAAAKIAASRALASYQVAHDQLRSTYAAQFKSAGLSTTGALLTSTSKDNYLDQLSALQLLSARRAAVNNQLAAARRAADVAQATSVTVLAEAQKKQKALAAQRTSLAADQDKYAALLKKLTAAQQAAYFAKTNPVASPAATRVAIQDLTAKPTTSPTTSPSSSTASPAAPAPSSAAAIAVQFALAQQGKPYVYASSGPDSYDCSGLTAAAWAAAGLQIPHVAALQYDIGTHVSRDQLQPGDLVFFYSPIGHVALYIGNGLIVHAPQPGDVVKVVALSIFDGDYVGATRL